MIIMKVMKPEMKMPKEKPLREKSKEVMKKVVKESKSTLRRSSMPGPTCHPSEMKPKTQSEAAS